VTRLTIAVSVLVLLIVSGANATTVVPTVPVTLTVTGAGVLRIAGFPQFVCTKVCAKTIRVRKGKRLAVTSAATKGWKTGPWAGACSGTTPTCRFKVLRASRLAVTFVPPGARSNPIPLGQAAPVGSKWRLVVNAVTANANAAVLAASGGASYAVPPAGAQDFMVNVTATYTGGGSSIVDDLTGYVEAVGSHKATYDSTTSCPGQWPDPSFKYVNEQQIFSGQSASGNICFLIASNDADSMELFAGSSSSGQAQIWFALR
jgi:hypothetical protein